MCQCFGLRSRLLRDLTCLRCDEELTCMDCNGLPLGYQGDVLLLWLQVGQLNYLGISHSVLFSIAYVAGGQQSAPSCRHHQHHHHFKRDSCGMGLAILPDSRQLNATWALSLNILGSECLEWSLVACCGRQGAEMSCRGLTWAPSLQGMCDWRSLLGFLDISRPLRAVMISSQCYMCMPWWT